MEQHKLLYSTRALLIQTQHEKKVYFLKVALELLFLEHYYNATNKNPLFALEAYKIYKDNEIPTSHDDWFMALFYSFSTNLLNIESECLGKERTNQSLVKALFPNRQSGRSIFYEYRKIKERFSIYLEIEEKLKSKLTLPLAIVDTAEKFSLSADRIEKIYKEEKKIISQSCENFKINAVSRKV